MTINSQSRKLCSRTERTAAPTVAALLRIDIMTETSGKLEELICKRAPQRVFGGASHHGQQRHTRQPKARLDDVET